VFKFTPGLSNIIPGFAEGVLGMKVGGKRRVIIPPALGYGNVQNGPIPPNSTLTFDITLVRVE
jgi:FKBP-type peptidyl-prolyl cis-trans isomerase